MDNINTRTEKLIGLYKLSKIESSTVLVVGLGGVGGTALQALVRSGFKSFIIIDFDNVDITNLNRQIMYSNEDIGKKKTDVCEKYLKSFNNSKVIAFDEFFDENTIEKLKEYKIDYVVDAIDSMDSKIKLIKYCVDNDICFISSLGMGNRIDPEQVTITTLNKTENDPLARKLRYELKHSGIDLKKVNVVFSKENPVKCEGKPSSMIMVPSTAGLLIAKYIIQMI